MSTSGYASSRTSFHLTQAEQALWVMAEGVKWLGGGTLFAVTLYLILALPGLSE